MLSEKETLETLRNDTRFDNSDWPFHLAFQLGGFRFQLFARGIVLTDSLPNWYQAFEPQPDSQVFTIRYLSYNELDPDLVGKLFEGNNRYHNVMVLSDPTYLAENEIAVFRWDFRALLRTDKLKARVYLLNNSPASIDAVARVATSLILNKANKLLVHGSSILVGDCGYLFIGVSGSGKSTISVLSRSTILNDEISLIDVGNYNSAPYVYGTPFHGDLTECRNQGGILVGIYLLMQSSETVVRSLDEYQQHLAVLRNSINFSQTVKSFDTITLLSHRLLKKVTVNVLEFENNNRFMELIT